MANIHVRNLSDAVHRALCVRAAQHRRSIEAEIRAILEAAVYPPERIKLGVLLVSIAREANGLTDEEHALFDAARDTTAVQPRVLE